ncbi:MAG: iron uptake system protein EfeO [Helicobacter sp.]|nr:iron uptake system protein EfeO [Helicobacter sp.]
MQKSGFIKLALGACLALGLAFGADYEKETDAYKNFVLDQIDNLESQTQKFVDALNSGNLAGAKQIYPLARMYYERSEPIAESFGDLDGRIDSRLADLQEEAKSTDKSIEEGWVGFHKIEKILWTQNTTKGTKELAQNLINDIKELRAKVPTIEVTPDLMINGAIDLLNEVSTSKITGEENIFAKTDLYDFQANIEGAQKIFEILKPAIANKNAKLAKDIQKRFDAVNKELKKYNKSKKGYDFISYDKLTPKQTRALAEVVSKLGEPLAQMGQILDK